MLMLLAVGVVAGAFALGPLARLAWSFVAGRRRVVARLREDREVAALEAIPVLDENPS